jgi:monoamine oxidase
MLFSQAFWRQKGFSGEVFCCGGPVSATYDATTHDDQPAIAGYMASKTGIQWSSKDVSLVSIELHLTEYCGSVVTMPTLYLGVPYSDLV